MREPRWIANQRTIQNAKQRMQDAVHALWLFRNNNADVSYFPQLRSYLYFSLRRPTPSDTIFHVSGWGTEERISRE